MRLLSAKQQAQLQCIEGWGQYGRRMQSMLSTAMIALEVETLKEASDMKLKQVVCRCEQSVVRLRCTKRHIKTAVCHLFKILRPGTCIKWSQQRSTRVTPTSEETKFLVQYGVLGTEKFFRRSVQRGLRILGPLLPRITEVSHDEISNQVALASDDHRAIRDANAVLVACRRHIKITTRQVRRYKEHGGVWITAEEERWLDEHEHALSWYRSLKAEFQATVFDQHWANMQNYSNSKFGFDEPNQIFNGELSNCIECDI